MHIYACACAQSPMPSTWGATTAASGCCESTDEDTSFSSDTAAWLLGGPVGRRHSANDWMELKIYFDLICLLHVALLEATQPIILKKLADIRRQIQPATRVYAHMNSPCTQSSRPNKLQRL